MIAKILLGIAAAAATAALAQGAPERGAQAVVVPSDATPPMAGIAPPLPADSASRFDQRLAERVANALAEDPALVGASLTVAAAGGNVALSGTTLDSIQASRARQIADSIAGVGHVSSSLLTQRP